MIIDIVESYDWAPVTIFYDQEQDIVLWSAFLSQKRASKVLQPTFLKLPGNEAEAEGGRGSLLQTLLGLKGGSSGAASSQQNNLVLFVHDLDKATKFMELSQTSGILGSNTNLLIGCLVSTKTRYFEGEKRKSPPPR
jgi:hypothetical protein